MAENKDFKEILDKAAELETIDFKNSEEFEYQEYYNAIEKISKQNGSLKSEEAENIISEIAPKFVDAEFLVSMDKKKEQVLDFLRVYDPNKPTVQAMSEHEVDKVYAISNYLVNSYINNINEILFDVEFSKLEIKFLDKQLMHNVEYNAEDVFTFAELHDNFWAETSEFYKANKNQETFTFKISIQHILIIHHLIKDVKVTGITNDFKSFRGILNKIAQTNKVFNAYNILVERIKEDCKLWGSALDSVLTPYDIKNEDIIPTIEDIIPTIEGASKAE